MGKHVKERSPCRLPMFCGERFPELVPVSRGNTFTCDFSYELDFEALSVFQIFAFLPRICVEGALQGIYVCLSNDFCPDLLFPYLV